MRGADAMSGRRRRVPPGSASPRRSQTAPVAPRQPRPGPSSGAHSEATAVCSQG